MTLNEYMQAYLGSLVSSLSLTDGFFDFVETEVLRIYGVESESDATDRDKLYAISKMVLWQKLMVEASISFDMSADGQSFKTSQLYDMFKNNFSASYYDAYYYLPDSVASVTTYPIRGSHEHKSQFC